MRCVYCQNYYFSQLDNGEETSIEGLAKMMLYLQRAGCHNINFVSPTHYVPQIILAIELAREDGLNIPLVYNTGGYDSVETLKLLDGIIDIYMPDMRYSDNAMAKRYSDAVNYVANNRNAVVEMQRQVGDLAIDDSGIARKGLIIRLLVLPEDTSGTKETLRFIKESVSPKAYLSLMSQYYPTFKANGFKEISRGVTRSEYTDVVEEAKRLGLNNGWIQEVPAGVDARFAGTNIKPGRRIK
jgi:putative pyruvate formate lyase activating enzyme